MLRIAMMGLAIVLAGPAMAGWTDGEGRYHDDDLFSPGHIYGTNSSTLVPLYTTPAYIQPAKHCNTGWVKVVVSSTDINSDIVYKCAAVGDLRDPE